MMSRLVAIPIHRLILVGLPALLVLAAGSAPSFADEPIYYVTVAPDYSGSVLVAPGPINGTTYTFTIQNQYHQPMPGQIVQVQFAEGIRVCADAVHHGVTDENGSCEITLRAGGCIAEPMPAACTFFANGIDMYVFHKVKSPDNASNDTSESNGLVNVADLVFFAQEFRGQVPPGCHDYNNDNQSTTADLPTFGDAFKLALACTVR